MVVLSVFAVCLCIWLLCRYSAFISKCCTYVVKLAKIFTYIYFYLFLCVFLSYTHLTCCQKANKHISQEVKAIIDNCHFRPAVTTIVVNIFVWTDIYMCSLWYNLFMQLSAQSFKPENAPVYVSRDCSVQSSERSVGLWDLCSSLWEVV